MEVAKGGIEDEHYKSNYNRANGAWDRVGTIYGGNWASRKAGKCQSNIVLTITTNILIWM